MIERIIIKNFKGIKEADISFHDKINVIVALLSKEIFSDMI